MSVPPWWRGAVIYEIYPRSFVDSNGDGVGDLPGIVQRLEYVAELGVDAIWIAPFFRSPMADFGYDVADYRAVDPLFGTMADFDQLLAQAHKLGLKVMIDQVLSHTSIEHEWFRESRQSRDNPKADWYVWADPKPDGTPPNNWLSIFGGVAWRWEPRRRQYYLHNFLSSQPDLNFHQPELRRAVLDNVRFWLDKGVDGLRLDAINFCFHDRELRDNPPKPADGRTTRGFSPENPYAYQYHRYDNTQPENLRFSRPSCAPCSMSIRTLRPWRKFPPRIRSRPRRNTRPPIACTWATASSCCPKNIRRDTFDRWSKGSKPG